jgi:pimeloyl-ACP methyl ester carboxylesterase
VIVVGYSLGGRLALRLLEETNELVRGLALISASPGIENVEARVARAAEDDERALAIVADFAAFRDSWYSAPLFALDPDQVASATSRRSGVDSAAAAIVVSALSPGRAPSSWDLLEKAAVPILCVAGERDEKYVDIVNACASRRLGPTETRILPSVGHSVHLDAPTALAAALSAWIARCVVP